MDKNCKIHTTTKKHLYASKAFFDPCNSTIIKLKTLETRNFNRKRVFAHGYLLMFSEYAKNRSTMA